MNPEVVKLFPILATPSALVQTFGRLHVAMVHFPIALLMLAGVLEAWRLVRRKPTSPTVATCALVGAGATVLAAVMGWILAGSGQYDEHQLALHRWAGVITAGLAVVTAILFLVGRRNRGAMRGFTVGALACAAMVGLTGHFGGELTYGEGYLTALLFPDADQTASAEGPKETEPATQPTVQTASLATPKKISFEKDVRPLLQSSCVECHGPTKMRGGLKLDSGAGILKGGNGGPALVAHDPDKSPIIRRVLGLDGKKRMPVDKPPLSQEQIALLKAWVAAGGDVGDVKADRTWVAHVEPRQVTPPPGDANPVDRLLAKYLTDHKVDATKNVDDRTFARRAYLDIIGMIPTVEELTVFEQDSSPTKRSDLVDKLLADSRRYAEHWMSFWDDALRNDYTGPGYIDGGRKAITNWLYESLKSNKPYDQFVTELVSPVEGSEGFSKGIVWRGAVSASQIPELQAAQNISQVFLGINMKCASCHDSFISDWKLADAYGLASVYSAAPLTLYRCEADQHKKAEVKFLYPQLGSIDATAPKEVRTKQLARALTSKEDGRFARTIVNRLWARLMGRGIVEPLDEMDNEPWNADLLDYLAYDLANAGKWDLKRTIKLIVTSRAYQMPSVGMADPNDTSFVFRGPVVKRMLAEQFVDAVSSLTGDWQQNPAMRPTEEVRPEGRWVWNLPGALDDAPPGTIYLRKEVTLDARPSVVLGAVACDNRYVMYVNGKKAMAGEDWASPDVKGITRFFNAGKNVIAIEATNDAIAPAGSAAATAPQSKNPAAVWAMLSFRLPVPGSDTADRILRLSTDASWRVSGARPPVTWTHAAFDASAWPAASDLGPVTDHYDVRAHLVAANKQYTFAEGKYRAVWAKNDRLMTALGRPNREQTVTYRPSAATTLEMLELTNGPELFDMIKRGAIHWLNDGTMTDPQRVDKIFLTALGRPPTGAERSAATKLLSSEEKQQGLEDLLWSVVMLPEFQLVY